MSEKLTIEKFGEIMDGFLQENEIDLLITLPEGSMDPKLQDNAGMGPVVQLYILLAALPVILGKTLAMMQIDESEKESVVDGMLEMVKGELLNPKEAN